MVRIKRGKIIHRKRERLLKKAKGFRWGRKAKYRLAKQALMKAWTHAYRERKRGKREIRKLWQIQINNACRSFGISYSKFIQGLKKNRIELNRKVLAQLSRDNPEVFKVIVEKVKLK